MKLSGEQLRSLMFGAAEIREEQGGLRGYKCTGAVRKAWGGLAPWLETYASHSTGVRLDFHTDSEDLSFLLSGGRFEVKIDGLLTRIETVGDGPSECSVSLPAGEHRVTLIFPSHGNGILYGARVCDGASLRPHQYAQSIHFLGDSITQGSYAEIDSLSYAWQVSEFFDAESIIHGVGGGYFHPSVFEPAPFDPDRVIVALGTNDFSWGFSPEVLRCNTAAYLDRVKEAYGTDRVTCILPIWRGDKSKPEELRPLFDETVSMIREEETARGFRVIDGLELVPHRPEFFTEDELHPNGLGFGIYAKNLIRRLI